MKRAKDVRRRKTTVKRRERQRGKEDRERCRDKWRQRKNLDGDSTKNIRDKKKK